MLVQVCRTHHGGRPVAIRALQQDPGTRGVLSVALVEDRGLRRACRIATLRDPARTVHAAVLPDLHDIELLAFANQAMMLTGYEVVDGCRLYQGWWVRWREAS